MGLEKVGTTFGKEIIAWTRTGGSKSLLATKPVKINTIGLKLAPVLEKDSFQISKSVGKHKIPRYLYHLTSRSNYEKMLETGTINLSYDEAFGEGIFFTDLQNLLKEWNKVDKNSGNNLLQHLLHHCAHDDAVLLKIPTLKLNIENLSIRSQKRLFSTQADILQEFGQETIERYAKELFYKNKYRSSIDAYVASMLHFIEKKYGAEAVEHLTKGDKAIFSKLYKQRKEAIEYIYKNKINISDVEKVGECSSTWSHKRIGEKCTPREIFETLLQGTKEQNNLVYLNV